MIYSGEITLQAPPSWNNLDPPHISGTGNGVFSIAERKCDELYQILKSNLLLIQNHV